MFCFGWVFPGVSPLSFFFSFFFPLSLVINLHFDGMCGCGSVRVALISALAAHFKREGKLEIPDWVDYQKTAVYKDLSPRNADWYYIRAAAILRILSIWQTGVGVKNLTKYFGGISRRGVAPNHKMRCYGSVIRKPVQSMKALSLIKSGKG